MIMIKLHDATLSVILRRARRDQLCRICGRNVLVG